MMASKQNILDFISAEGFAASGYEEKVLTKFVAFLEAPAPVEEVVAEPAPKKSKVKADPVVEPAAE